MRCPFCASLEDKVLESRTMSSGESIRRRRECTSCGARFTSYERIEEKPLMVVKRDGSREPFDRRKIEKGIDRALEKRAIATNTVESLVNEIEGEAVRRGGSAREVAATEIGELALEKLFALDKVAYIRFASVYKHFEDIDEFIAEVKSAGGGKRKKKQPPLESTEKSIENF